MPRTSTMPAALPMARAAAGLAAAAGCVVLLGAFSYGRRQPKASKTTACEQAQRVAADDRRAGGLRYFRFGFAPLPPGTVQRVQAAYQIHVLDRGCAPSAFEACYNRYVDSCVRQAAGRSMQELLR